MAIADCGLCELDSGVLVLRNVELRVVLADDADYPGFARVVWNAHVREMTDLAPPQIARLMGAVFAVEDALRVVYKPLKINLASLGNLTPHVHWHVIARFADDPHYPKPIWGERQREGDAASIAARRALLPRLTDEIRARIKAR